MNPGSIQVFEPPRHAAGSLEIVVPYTGLEITARVVEKAATLCTGLNATLKLVAVYVAPYPADLVCPAAMEEHLRDCLTKIAGCTRLPSNLQIVVARNRDEGFRFVLRPASAVLIGTVKRPWRTREERLAAELAREGHHVSLLQLN